MSLSAAYWPDSEPAPTPAAELRALTIHQPWAACIASGQKLTENRTWATKHRGPLAIHAGADFDKYPALRPASGPASIALDAYYDAPSRLWVRSAVLAVVSLDDCHPYEPGCCASPWAEREPGRWHWVLADVRALPEPVPCKGALSLWRPSADVTERVLAQIGVPT